MDVIASCIGALVLFVALSGPAEAKLGLASCDVEDDPAPLPVPSSPRVGATCTVTLPEPPVSFCEDQSFWSGCMSAATRNPLNHLRP